MKIQSKTLIVHCRFLLTQCDAKVQVYVEINNHVEEHRSIIEKHHADQVCAQ